MSKLSKRDSLFLIVMGLIAVLGGTYWFYVKPARADLTAKTAAVEEAQGNVDTLSGQLQQLQAAAKKPKKENPFDALILAKAYPYSPDTSVAAIQLETVAKKAHVTLGQVVPGTGTDYAGVTGTSFTIDVTGKFFEVQDFIHRMHSQVTVNSVGALDIKGRLIAVTQADISPGGGDAAASSGSTASTGTTSSSKITANLTIVVFSRAAAGAGGAAPAAGGAPAGGATQQPTSATPASTSGGNQ